MTIEWTINNKDGRILAKTDPTETTAAIILNMLRSGEIVMWRRENANLTLGHDMRNSTGTTAGIKTVYGRES